MNISSNVRDRELDKFFGNSLNETVVRVSDSTSSAYLNSLTTLIEMRLRGVDICKIPLLINDRGLSITLNDGTLIYTE